MGLRAALCVLEKRKVSCSYQDSIPDRPGSSLVTLKAQTPITSVSVQGCCQDRQEAVVRACGSVNAVSWLETRTFQDCALVDIMRMQPLRTQNFSCIELHSAEASS